MLKFLKTLGTVIIAAFAITTTVRVATVVGEKAADKIFEGLVKMRKSEKSNVSKDGES